MRNPNWLQYKMDREVDEKQALHKIENEMPTSLTAGIVSQPLPNRTSRIRAFIGDGTMNRVCLKAWSDDLIIAPRALHVVFKQGKCKGEVVNLEKLNATDKGIALQKKLKGNSSTARRVIIFGTIPRKGSKAFKKLCELCSGRVVLFGNLFTFNRAPEMLFIWEISKEGHRK